MRTAKNTELAEFMASDAVEREIFNFEYALWAAAQVRLKQNREAGVRPDARTKWLLENVVDLIDGDCELHYAVMYAMVMGVELLLVLKPQTGSYSDSRYMHASRLAQSTSIGDFMMLNFRVRVRDFINEICKDKLIDYLCWGSNLTEKEVTNVIAGKNTQLRTLCNVFRAAGFETRLGLDFEQGKMLIGGPDFDREFPEAGKSFYTGFRRMHASRLASSLGRSTLTRNSWDSLLGDIE